MQSGPGTSATSVLSPNIRGSLSQFGLRDVNQVRPSHVEVTIRSVASVKAVIYYDPYLRHLFPIYGISLGIANPVVRVLPPFACHHFIHASGAFPVLFIFRSGSFLVVVRTVSCLVCLCQQIFHPAPVLCQSFLLSNVRPAGSSHRTQHTLSHNQAYLGNLVSIYTLREFSFPCMRF